MTAKCSLCLYPPFSPRRCVTEKVVRDKRFSFWRDSSRQFVNFVLTSMGSNPTHFLFPLFSRKEKQRHRDGNEMYLNLVGFTVTTTMRPVFLHYDAMYNKISFYNLSADSFARERQCAHSYNHNRLPPVSNIHIRSYTKHFQIVSRWGKKEMYCIRELTPLLPLGTYVCVYIYLKEKSFLPFALYTDGPQGPQQPVPPSPKGLRKTWLKKENIKPLAEETRIYWDEVEVRIRGWTV
jgi:hypothetical protein